MKKIFALMLALMMMFSFAACGSKDSGEPAGTDTDPGASQQEPADTQEDGEEPDTTPQGGDAAEGSMFGWTEDDIKPDGVFDSMRKDESLGYVISLTGPLGADGYRGWYKKLLAKSADLADGGKLFDLAGNSIDPEETVFPGIENNIEMMEGGAGPFYIMWYYEAGDKKISVATYVKDLDSTEEVLNCLIGEYEGM